MAIPFLTGFRGGHLKILTQGAEHLHELVGGRHGERWSPPGTRPALGQMGEWLRKHLGA